MADYSELFLQDSIDKQMTITSDNGVVITNTELHGNEFELHESLCSENQLKFGSCESASIKFKISYVRTSLKDHWLTVKVKIGDNEPYQYGVYKVASDVPTADREFREVEAYDSLHDIIMSDVADWYNTILPNENSTVTLKQFRDSFFNHFGITQETINLPQDDMTVEKTIDPSEISGKDVLTAICEINGCFGHIGRDGKFQYVFIGDYTEGLYPRNDLYPANDLYPIDATGSTKIERQHYISAEYEDYTVKRINKLQIRQSENDIGAIIGAGDNCYIVEDNFLVYGKSANELSAIAQTLYVELIKVHYRPVKMRMKGNPTFFVGDSIRLNTKYEIIYTYILERTLKGVQALYDEIDAQGEEYYNKGLNSVNKSIVQLKGKTNELTRTVEETNSRITDVQAGLQSEISQTAESITTSVSQTYETKTDATSKLNEAKSDATSKANAAENNAKGYTDNQLTGYSTTTQMNSAISQSASNITSSVSATYETKADATTKLNSAKTYADTKASDAESNANTATDNKLLNYSTTTQMNSAISQSASSIESTVSATYETKADATNKMNSAKDYADDVAQDAENNANDATDAKLQSYSTTTQMNSAITQKANEITQTVSETYETQSNANTQYTTLSSGITQNATAIESTVKDGEISSKISQEAGSVSIKSNRMTIESSNFKLAADGTVDANGTLTSGNSSKKVGLLNAGCYAYLNDVMRGGFTAIAMGTVLHNQGATDDYVQIACSLTDDGSDLTTVFRGHKTKTTYIANGLNVYKNFNNSDGLTVHGPLSCTGTKNRIVDTKHYGTVGMNAVESADALFTDTGSGKISDDGKCYVYFDDVFAETIETSCDYQVMLTRTSEAETKWVEKHELYFIVYGEAGAAFDWMILAKQKDYSMNRMEYIRISDDRPIEFDEFLFDEENALDANLMTYVMDYNNIENDILTGGM